MMQNQNEPDISIEWKNEILINKGLEDLQLISKTEITKLYLELDNDEDHIK